MLHKLSLRKASRTVMFLMTCFILTGCYTLRNVSVTNIPQERTLLIVHADLNYWIVEGYSVSDGVLTARICPETGRVRKYNSAHLYVAPLEAVTIEDNMLTVPIANIAKSDYLMVSFLETLRYGAPLALVIYTLTILIFS